MKRMPLIYFAVEKRQGEADIAVVELVIRSLSELKKTTIEVEVLDTFSLGSLTFLRFRMRDKSATRLTDHLFAKKERAVVRLEGTEFSLQSKSKAGVVPSTKMLAAPLSAIGFRGPGAPFWERQFTVR